ncbi:MAG: ammonium transporter, partial [Paucibacter sp.]|nr:ammonium transporter [Roseateles sp.]
MKKILACLALAAAVLAPAAWAQQDAAASAAVVTAAAPAASATDMPAAPSAAVTAPAEAAAAAAPAPVPNKGDTSWMLLSTLLVIMMTIPGLALFYGGLVRSKNMLSVLMQ